MCWTACLCCYIDLVDSFWYAGVIDVHAQNQLQAQRKALVSTGR